MTERWTAWGPATIWAAVLFFLSALPGTGAEPFLFPGEDKVAHLGLYGVFGALLARGWLRRRPAVSVWAAPVVGLIWAVSDEWHQSFVPGRHPSAWDLAADTVGLLLGYALLSILTVRCAPRGAADATS